MKLSTKDLTETRKSLTVVTTPQEVAQQERDVIKEFKKHARVSGFRPGKAPDPIVKRQYAKEIAEELDRKLISQSYKKVKSDATFDILTIVDIQKSPIQSGVETTITFTLDIRPSFELPNYKGIPVKKSQNDLQEGDIDTALQKIREQRAQYTIVDTPAKKGDYVRISYQGTIDGQLITDITPDHPLYGKQEDIWREVGAEELEGASEISNLLKAAIGMKAGDTCTVSVDFPKECKVPALSGKAAVYEMNIIEIREKHLPDIDEAFLKSFQADNLEALRTQIKSSLEREKKNESFQAKRQQVIKYMTDSVDFPLPQSAIESETHRILQEHIHHKLRHGATQNDIEAQKPEITQQARETASKRVKLNLILEKIAQAEGIQTKEKDLQNALVSQALYHSKEPHQYIKKLSKDRERIALIHRNILFEKTLQFIVDHTEATLKD